MVEIKGNQIQDSDRDSPAGDAHTGSTRARRRDPLMLAIMGTAIGLAVLVLGADVFWGSGPVLFQAPWYIPLISAFVALTTLCVSYLALGRYYVMRDPLSFWAGTGFAVYGIGQIFYALTWQGITQGGGSILGHLANTPAWISLVDLAILNVFLLVSVMTRWPASQSMTGTRWLQPVLAAVVVVIVGFGLLIYFEESLPVFVSTNGTYTTPMRVWVAIQLFLFASGSLLSSIYYHRFGDKLAGYIAFPQLALACISVMVLIGGKRYDLWWYMQRTVLVVSYLTVLFGLLTEYVRLLKRESEGTRLLDAILENIPIGLTVTDGPPHFNIVRVSRHGLKMNQGSVDSLTALPSDNHQADWRILFPNGETLLTAEQMPLYRASRFGEEVRNVELVMQAQDGQQIPVLVNASPIRDAQGNIVAAVNTWLDIIDRKRAESILKESEALYRAIARSIPNGGVFVVDRNLRYLIVEGQVTAKFGYSRERLEGHTVSEIFDADTAAKMEARFHRVFAGETISYETEHAGRIYWTQHALMDEPLEHAIVVTVDITERKQAEKALIESQQRFSAIVNQATAGIIRSDMAGRSIFVNQALCTMLGFTEADLTGETLWTFTYRDDFEESKRLYDRLMKQGIPFQMEERFIRRDGSTLWVSVSTAPILDEVGKPQSAVSVVMDITERKQAEADLHQLNLQLESRVEKRTAQLQTANTALLASRKRLQTLSQRLVEIQEQERSALARELHDRVGQSLTALNLNMTIIGDQISEKKASPITGRLADSIKLVTEMISIVRDVMSDLRPVVLDEYGLVAALSAYIEKFEKRYDIPVEFTRSHATMLRLGAAVEMTILRIAQEAMLNIARHAQADHVALSLKCEENAMLLMIQDNGVGMQDGPEGNHRSGHGLMIMRERAEAIGGTLKITSAAGEGMRIDASLPFQNDDGNSSNDEENK